MEITVQFFPFPGLAQFAQAIIGKELPCKVFAGKPTEDVPSVQSYTDMLGQTVLQSQLEMPALAIQTVIQPRVVAHLFARKECP